MKKTKKNKKRKKEKKSKAKKAMLFSCKKIEMNACIHCKRIQRPKNAAYLLLVTFTLTSCLPSLHAIAVLLPWQHVSAILKNLA
jgi:hypothetical protein